MENGKPAKKVAVRDINYDFELQDGRIVKSIDNDWEIADPEVVNRIRDKMFSDFKKALESSKSMHGPCSLTGEESEMLGNAGSI